MLNTAHGCIIATCHTIPLWYIPIVDFLFVEPQAKCNGINKQKYYDDVLNNMSLCELEKVQK